MWVRRPICENEKEKNSAKRYWVQGLKVARAGKDGCLGKELKGEWFFNGHYTNGIYRAEKEYHVCAPNSRVEKNRKELRPRKALWEIP